jgi:Zn-dependent protease with chaperone function
VTKGRHRIARCIICHASEIALSGGIVAIVSLIFGRFAGGGLLGWLAVGVLLTTRRGSRLAARLVGFRPVAAADSRAGTLWAEASAVNEVGAGQLELWIAPRREAVNAFAIGRDIVAVTHGFAAAYDSGALEHGHAVAVLTHEIGHHRAGDPRLGYAIGWMAFPWRLASTVLSGVVRGVLGRPPILRVGRLMAPATCAIVTARLVYMGQLLPVIVLALLVLALRVQPVLAARLSRLDEFAADAHAAKHGLGAELAGALAKCGGDTARPRRWLATHPASAERIERLHHFGALTGRGVS